MDTRGIVRRFILKNFYVAAESELTDDTSLVDYGIVDSTGMLELTAFIEQSFGMAIQDHEITPENLGTVRGIVDFIERSIGEPEVERRAG